MVTAQGVVSVKLIIDIILFVVGVVLIALSFVGYKRKGESEISQDVLMTPKFIAGIVILIIAIIVGFIF